MNAYILGRCKGCGYLVELTEPESCPGCGLVNNLKDEHFQSTEKTVMVHGAVNYNLAIRLWRESEGTMGIEEMQKYFCMYCGNYKGEDKCSCSTSKEAEQENSGTTMKDLTKAQKEFHKEREKEKEQLEIKLYKGGKEVAVWDVETYQELFEIREEAKVKLLVVVCK